MLSSGGGSWCSLLQLPKFMIHKLLFKSEIPQSWPPISLNNSMMQKIQMSPSSQCLCRRVTKWHDLGFGNFSDCWTTWSWKAFNSHRLWNRRKFRKWHHLTHYQQGANFYTLQSWCQHSQQWKLGKVHWYEPEYELIWAWSNCSFVEAHQVRFQSSAGAGNWERQHSVQQAERVCAPDRLHRVSCAAHTFKGSWYVE